MAGNSRFKPISDYGLIGNRHSVALAGLDGSIDWCCFPRFDAPSLFAAILDPDRGGKFLINPVEPFESSQRYVGDTNVLETTFTTASGACNLVDCMPIYRTADGAIKAEPSIVRRVTCTAGSIPLRIVYEPRPDYGRAVVALRSKGTKVALAHNNQRFTLHSPIPLTISESQAVGSIVLQTGERMVFTLSYEDSEWPPKPDKLDPEVAIAQTRDYWTDQVASLRYEGPWREYVLRSYLVLRLLVYLPTGAIIAAPTTSLPEELGGVRNWDYRFTWLRDAVFTVDALLSLNRHEVAMSFFEWLAGVCERDWADLYNLYRVDGQLGLPEEVLSNLSGYMSSAPVRIGNGAADQEQNDIYGEVLATASLLEAAGQPVSDRHWRLLETLADHAAERWMRPDSGIWEVRGGLYHFVYSKAMCWVALDRAVALAKRTGREGPASQRWAAIADAVREDVLRRGWNEQKRAFVQHYDTTAMDASDLLLPIIDFLPPDDSRILSTIERIQQELQFGPFVHRYRTEETDDGLAGSEGAFILCSFWLVRALAKIGRAQEARALFEQLLRYGNHLGLFSEMVDPNTGAALGNFPQAFTHIGLILAAKECSSTLYANN